MDALVDLRAQPQGKTFGAMCCRYSGFGQLRRPSIRCLHVDPLALELFRQSPLDLGHGPFNSLRKVCFFSQALSIRISLCVGLTFHL